MSALLAGVSVLVASDAVWASDPLAARLRTEVSSAFVGEPLWGSVEVTNVSPNPVALMTTWTGSSNVRVVVSVTDSHGKSWERRPFDSPGTPMVERVVFLGSGDDYRALIGFSTLAGRPGRYSLTVSAEFTGKARYFDRDAGKAGHRKVWAGKIISKPLTITIKPLVEPADIAALKVLCRTEKQFRDGPYYSIWSPHSTTKGGDSRFRTVLEKYPGSVFAKHAELAEARVWAGSLARESAPYYDKAIHHLTRLIEGYWTSHISDDAELLLARVYLRREISRSGKGYRDKAIGHLRHLIATYSKSDSVPAAKKLLAEATKAKEAEGKGTKAKETKDKETKSKEAKAKDGSNG